MENDQPEYRRVFWVHVVEKSAIWGSKCFECGTCSKQLRKPRHMLDKNQKNARGVLRFRVCSVCQKTDDVYLAITAYR